MAGKEGVRDELGLEGLRAVAERAADAAARVIEAALERDDWTVRVKPDDTPVTDVDVAAERAIRAVLTEATPAASFFGEETGESDGGVGAAIGDAPTGASAAGERAPGAARAGGAAPVSAEDGDAPAGPSHRSCSLRWLVDPIDGTRAFVRRLPYFSTQIALAVDGELVVGVSNAPRYGVGGERLVGVAGGAARLDGRAVRTSAVGRLEDAFLSGSNLGSLARDGARWARYGALVARVRRSRGYGDFCHYHQLARGACDLVVESDVNILDIAALTVAVRAAGGVVTDLDGAAIDEATTSVLAAANAELHAAALETLRPPS